MEPAETMIVYPVANGENLDPGMLARVLDVLGAVEVLVMPGLSRHPHAHMILEQLSSSSSRIAVVSRPGEVYEVLKALSTPPKPNIELLVYTSPVGLEPSVYRSLQLAYEHGLDMVSLYLYCRSAEDYRRALKLARNRLGLPVHYRVGPPLYEHHPHIASAVVAAELGLRVALPYGILYGYRARRVYLDGETVATLLEKPCPRSCRKLTVTPHGVYKCPFTPTAKAVRLDPDALFDLVRSSCTGGVKTGGEIVDVKVVVECNGVPIPEDIVRVLLAVSELGSIRAACKSLGLSPSQVVEKIHKLEKRIGAKLVESRRGGQGGGYTTLTRLGERIVRKYLAARRSLEYLDVTG